MAFKIIVAFSFGVHLLAGVSNQSVRPQLHDKRQDDFERCLVSRARCYSLANH